MKFIKSTRDEGIDLQSISLKPDDRFKRKLQKQLVSRQRKLAKMNARANRPWRRLALGGMAMALTATFVILAVGAFWPASKDKLPLNVSNNKVSAQEVYDSMLKRQIEIDFANAERNLTDNKPTFFRRHAKTYYEAEAAMPCEGGNITDYPKPFYEFTELAYYGLPDLEVYFYESYDYDFDQSDSPEMLYDTDSSYQITAKYFGANLDIAASMLEGLEIVDANGRPIDAASTDIQPQKDDSGRSFYTLRTLHASKLACFDEDNMADIPNTLGEFKIDAKTFDILEQKIYQEASDGKWELYMSTKYDIEIAYGEYSEFRQRFLDAGFDEELARKNSRELNEEHHLYNDEEQEY